MRFAQNITGNFYGSCYLYMSCRDISLKFIYGIETFSEEMSKQQNSSSIFDCHIRVGRWSKVPVAITTDCVHVKYVKLTREPLLEREVSLASEYFNRKYASVSQSCIPETTNVKPKAKEISVEEAEKITNEMIHSFSHNRTMKDLLEGAKFFAGAKTLCGAVITRRSRTQIKRFEAY